MGQVSSAGAECPPDSARGERGDRLRVGFAPFAPFALPAASDGKVHGLAVEPLRAIAAREGWTLDFVELSYDTLLRRIAGCQLDLGIAGVPVSTELAGRMDFSTAYLSTLTTVVVHADDATRAGPNAGRTTGGRIAHAGLRGLLWGLVALAVLAVSSWLLNAANGWRRRHALRWRRADATVSGPLAGLRWLWRSTTGRVLAAIWIAIGIILGSTGTGRAVQPLLFGDGALVELVTEAARTDTIVGEREPDGTKVPCLKGSVNDCLHGFADGALAALAGSREVLCSRLADLALDDVVIRDDLGVPRRYAYFVPHDSPLRTALNRGLLVAQEAGEGARPTRCPGAHR
jgi:ABC-type amino acid transport substrate-binding protein